MTIRGSDFQNRDTNVVEGNAGEDIVDQGQGPVTGTGPGDPGYGEPDANVDLADLLYFVNEWQTGLVECP